MTSFDELLSSFNKSVDVRGLGKRAAELHLSSAKPLNDAVVEVVKEAGLRDAHVDRVVEEANKAVFITLFKTGSFGKNIEFPVADVKSVRAAVCPTTEKTASPASVPPGIERTASAGVKAMQARGANALLDRLFGRELEKVAKVLTINNDDGGLRKLGEYKTKKAAIEGHMLQMDTEFSVKLAQLGTVVRRSAETDGIHVVEGCLAAAKPSSELAFLIKKAYGVEPNPQALSAMYAAGMPPAPGNAVTGLVEDMDSIAGKMMQANVALQKVMAGISEVQAVLKGSGQSPNAMFGGAPQPAAQQPPPADPAALQPETGVPQPTAQPGATAPQ